MRAHHWLLPAAVLALIAVLSAQTTLANPNLTVSVDPRSGAYSIASRTAPNAVILRADVGAKVNGHWLRSSQYSSHQLTHSSFRDELGAGQQIVVTHTGLPGAPALVTTVRLYDTRPYGDVEVEVRNTTGNSITVQAIRTTQADTGPVVDLGGAPASDRVLSDNFQEGAPQLEDLGAPKDGLHLGAGIQLIYNRETGQSLFWGGLTSRKFIPALHLRVAGGVTPRILSYTIDSEGTTEFVSGDDEGLHNAPPENRIELSLPIATGQSLASERMMFAAGSNYHAQLEAYGEAIRILHHARVTAPTPIGWWSWTAYYSHLSEDTALTNIEWLSQNLRYLGYIFFHVDEGYQYARGEYATADATLFPHGMHAIGQQICSHGLLFGIWTAPFEVSSRAWVYEHHPDWLVKNAQGKPIEVARVAETEPVYTLDVTNPGAQQYLRQTYDTLFHRWGVRYIKLDFMDTTAIEGYYYRPHTTAVEAQQIGLRIIREVAGDDILIDKDGSMALPPVGIVDAGRVSEDTGHSFVASRDAAPGIAARYYMNRTWFINDPDAFSVSREVLVDRVGQWHQSPVPLTLDEAKVQIALSAVSGGMFEIGDDLPTLGADLDRLALVENRDLIDMARLGLASTPIDLMSYRPEDQLPSIFFVQEDRRQSMLSVFNWTERPLSHRIRLSDLGLRQAHWSASDVFDGSEIPIEQGAIILDNQPKHSVRMIKFIDADADALPPSVIVNVPATATVGEAVVLSAKPTADVPALGYRWEFGDGTSAEGATVKHAYTLAGRYSVLLTVDGMDGVSARPVYTINAVGNLKSRFQLGQNRRYVEP